MAVIVPKAGHCTRCDQPIWTIVRHQRTDHPFLLWPDPGSVYVVVETPHGMAAGIGFHAACSPEVDEPLGADIVVRITGGASEIVTTVTAAPVVERVAAPIRYGAWYDLRFGEWLRAWLSDHLELPEAQREQIEMKWARDSSMVRERGAAAWLT